jgi:hypothetical protein
MLLMIVNAGVPLLNLHQAGADAAGAQIPGSSAKAPICDFRSANEITIGHIHLSRQLDLIECGPAAEEGQPLMTTSRSILSPRLRRRRGDHLQNAFLKREAEQLVIALGLGAAAGAAIIQSHHDEAAKSQAEKDDEAGCEWLCDLIWDFLDDWESEPCESEDDYTDDLVDYLRDEVLDVRAPDDDRRIKVEKRVRTEFGVPDVIIDDRLVLELKLGPHEGEKDRLIGQCCKYSVEWVTWAVVLGMSRKKARKLVKLLQQKSLHYIEVIEFDLIEADDEDDE